MSTSGEHWDTVYRTRGPSAVSWFQAVATTSARLLRAAVLLDGPVVDVGAGASTLVDALLSCGYNDITVLDTSAEALDLVRRRLDGDCDAVTFLEVDLLSWRPQRQYAGWHDRAVFHFLTSAPDRAAYVELATGAVATGGALVLGTFAHDGPQRCSGLPTARYDATSLAALFEPAFTLESAEREEHVTPEGVVQPFTWVVLRRGSTIRTDRSPGRETSRRAGLR